LKEMVCCHFINTDLKSDLEKSAMIFEPTEHDFEEVKKSSRTSRQLQHTGSTRC
jgi:hypothetical protein